MFPFLSVMLWCFWNEYENKFIIWPIGLAVIIIGGLLRLWAIRYIGRSARTRKEKAKTLLIVGPYAIIRNPLYVANILICLGACTLFGLLWYLPILCLALLVHYTIVAYAEESFLTEKYGEEYLKYKQMVPRWFPFKLSSPLINTPPDFSWQEALKRETPGGLLILGVLLLTVVKDIVGNMIFG